MPAATNWIGLAVPWNVEDRVLVEGKSTVVFG